MDQALRDVMKDRLTQRERECVVLWNSGLGYRRVAATLGISPSTVQDAVKRALRKLEQDERFQDWVTSTRRKKA